MEELRKVFDGHNDSVHRMREYREGGIDFLERNEKGHLDLPRAREAGLGGGLFAMFVYPEQPPKDALTLTETGYEVRMAEAIDPAYAQREIAKQMAALKTVRERSGGSVRIATTVGEIEEASDRGELAMVLHMEGAEAIGPELRELEELYGQGLRSLGPVWSRPNLFGYGVPFAWPRSPDTGPGLTPLGKELVRGCHGLGVMVDLSHLNERGFWDVAEMEGAPLVATHACVHSISATARNLTDRQLDAIRESDGMVGVNLCVSDLREDGRREENTPLETVVRHFVFLAERIGVERVGIGSDFDGAPIPARVGDVRGLVRLLGALRESGFDEASLRMIAWENWMRVLGRCWLER